jgi:hypothetical protein
MRYLSQITYLTCFDKTQNSLKKTLSHVKKKQNFLGVYIVSGWKVKIRPKRQQSFYKEEP